MPITGVYFIPANPNSTTALPTITERLHSTFTDADLIPISRWALEHKLMRDTPGLLPSAQRTQKPRYMQFLSLSHYPTHGFIYTSEPAEKPFHPPSTAPPNPPPPAGAANGITTGGGADTPIPPATQPTSAPMSTTPSQTGTAASQPTTTPAGDLPPMQMTTVPPPSYGTLFHHVTYACQPFWCHRMTVTVPNGVVYELGDFRVRLGDVRQTYPTGRVRGTVVEIEWRGPLVVDSLTALPGGRGVDGSSSGFAHGTGVGIGTGAGAGAGGAEQDADSGIDVSFYEIEEADVEAEFAATASLIRGFWERLGVEGGREAILVPGVGKEVKEKLVRWRDEKGRRKGRDLVRAEVELGPGVGVSGLDDDPDPLAGVDLARQYMEVLRFNR